MSSMMQTKTFGEDERLLFDDEHLRFDEERREGTNRSEGALLRWCLRVSWV
ncbi:hypothetical protein BVRB_9g204410 [Beta vulgaris subsp. vulgaris]|nr:hypothetical protein BVRB_9g204410 [Beta vulgaris subsp. vulgaris]